MATMPPDAPATVADAAGDPVAIVCGGGSFPGAVAEAVARRGRRPVMFAIRGWADPVVVERYTHHWIAIGQAGRFLRLARSEHCREALLIGTLLRPPLSQIRLDWASIRLLPRTIEFFRGGDNRLLSGLAKLFEDAGLRIVGIEDVAPEIIVQDGALGRHQPSARDRLDIARALRVIAALGAFDVGQAVVAANEHVLAVEAAEGTDHMLARVAQLRAEGRVTTPAGVGVLVKAPKPGQDRRFDLPAIGPRTIENVARAGLAGLAVAAGSTIIAEPAQTIAAADRTQIFLAGVRQDAPG
jgi:UDP-2,3-diacylglucosamine hydrolase